MEYTTLFQIISIIALVLAILLLFYLKKTSRKREERRIEEEIRKRAEKKRERLSALSEEEKRATLAVTMKERTSFINSLEKEFSLAFHPFANFEYKTTNAGSDALITRSIGYYKAPKGTDRIAAFFFSGDLEYDKINSITLNINGMVNRRFEGFSEYMTPRTFDVKENDLLTIEVEFDVGSDFSLKDFGILILKRK